MILLHDYLFSLILILDFFEEVAKFRAARRIWARVMKEKYRAQSERSLKLRFMLKQQVLH